MSDPQGLAPPPDTSYSTPLIALDAVALDTETTGLDARSARLIQVAALPVVAGRPRPDHRFERLVNPGIPIPKASVAIHGITDAKVADAPAFNDIAGLLEAYIGRAVVIGYAAAYDLAVLEREYALAGRPAPRLRALDVRTLARLAAPSLADYSLEALCEWLDVKIGGRHTALGDARAAGEIFLALIPLLRAKDIRTLAEAEAASRALAEREAASLGGYPPASQTAVDAQPVLARIDSFPYRHRIRDVMSAPAAFAAPETTVREAMRLPYRAAHQQRVRASAVRGERHRHRARPLARHRCGRRGGADPAHRADRQGAAADAARGRLPLPRHRPHRAAGLPPPGRHGCLRRRSWAR